MEEVQVVKWCVSREAGSIFEATGGSGCRLIRMMCGMRLVDTVSTDVCK